MIKIEPAAWEVMVSHARSTYPNECCGAMIGSIDGDRKTVQVAVALENAFTGAQGARYELRQEDLLKADAEARRQGMDLIGIFHSHPDSPNNPSDYDRDWAQPFFSYIITSIYAAKAVQSRSWLLSEDRTHFDEEEIKII